MGDRQLVHLFPHLNEVGASAKLRERDGSLACPIGSAILDGGATFTEELIPARLS
jgi:hypothetical protein